MTTPTSGAYRASMGTMTFGQFAALMQQRASDCERELREATRKATDLVHAESKAIMNRDIYSKPEDRTGYSRDSNGGLFTHVTVKPVGRLRKRKVESVGGQLVAYADASETIAGGKKKWSRKGVLRNQERSDVLSAYTGVVENAARHALPRHNLGYGPGDSEAIDPKPLRRKKTMRQAPFRTQAIARTAQQRFELYRAAWRYVLFR